MKNMKTLKVLIGLCLAAMTAVLLLDFWPEEEAQYSRRRFTFVCPLAWTNVAAGILDADEEYDTDTRLVGSEELDVERQVQAIDEAILSKVDGIITAAAVDSQELSDAVTRAQESGIPVILIDSDIPDSSRSCYIGTDNRAAGVLAGQDMYEATGGHACIGIIVSTLTASSQQERLEGFYEQIASYEDMQVIEVVECHSNRQEVLEKVPALLEEHPEINALLLTEAYASTLVGTLMQEQGISPEALRVVAFDAIRDTLIFLEDQTYYSIISQSPYQEGYKAVETLNALLDGVQPESIIYTDVFSVTLETMQTVTDHSEGGQTWHMY